MKSVPTYDTFFGGKTWRMHEILLTLSIVAAFVVFAVLMHLFGMALVWVVDAFLRIGSIAKRRLLRRFP